MEHRLSTADCRNRSSLLKSKSGALATSARFFVFVVVGEKTVKLVPNTEMKQVENSIKACQKSTSSLVLRSQHPSFSVELTCNIPDHCQQIDKTHEIGRMLVALDV